jgi:hypothetical protein
MANEKIHEYLDTANVNDLENFPVHIDCEVNGGSGWLSKQLPVTAISDYVNAPFQKVFGAFQDRSNQIHLNLNQGRAVQCNSTMITQGVSVTNDVDGRPTLFLVQESGFYNIQFSLQFSRTTGGSSKQASIWLRQNYNDVAWTNTHMTFVSNSGKLVASWNFVVQANISEPIQLMWSVDELGIQMIAEVANAVHPATPSAIITICKL